MQIIKNIAVLFITLTFFISSNGFIFEKYLCLSCDLTHNDVAFFEFGEISHNHGKKCIADSHCSTDEHICDCCNNSEEHEENSEVTYYLLDVVFQDTYDIDIKHLIPSEKIIIDFDIFNDININSLISSKIQNMFKLLKIPPIISQFESSANFCAALSIFRL